MTRPHCTQCSEPASYESRRCRSCGFRFFSSSAASTEERHFVRIVLGGLAFAALAVIATAIRTGHFF